MIKSIIKKLMLVILIITSMDALSQTYGQDADGYTNIITPTSQLSLDIANNLAIFEYITYTRNNKYLLGGRVSGKSENGVTLLFSEEKIAASSTVDVLIGRAFSEKIKVKLNKVKNLETLKFEAEKIKEDKIKSLNTFLKAIPNTKTYKLINILKSKSYINPSIPQKTIDIEKLYKVLMASYNEEIDELNREFFDEDTSKEKRNQIEAIKAEANPSYILIKSKLDDIILASKASDTVTKNFTNYAYNEQFINHLFFLRTGFTGSGFKYDLDNNATTIDDRFVDKNFYGWRAEFGYNINIKRTHFGISLQAAYLNNLAGLDEISYSLSKSDSTITEGSFSSSQSIKAFAGELDNFNRYSFNLDFAQLVPLSQSEGKTYLSINGYIRQRTYANTENFKNHLVLGTGIYALSTKKNQILGGLFVQTNDVFGANSKKDSTFGNRIVFGLVAKFAFKGIDK